MDEIVNFWFGELSPKDWFRKDEALDSTIASRFGTTYHELRSGVSPSCRHAGRLPRGDLDQFPRNMFRTVAAASPPMARRFRSPNGQSPKA
jgi:uncharacterized protein (DUF924 family)